MAPAGNFECLHAAIQGGADSVYFGVEKLNMRSHSANNFKMTDLAEIVRICSEYNVKTYLTLNIALFNEDIEDMKRTLDAAKAAGITAVIASDMAAIIYARQIGVEVHISTQLSISNAEALRFYAQFADVIVLARELNLGQVKEIKAVIDRDQICGPSGRLVEIEMFAHGPQPPRIRRFCKQRFMLPALPPRIQGRGPRDRNAARDRQQIHHVA